MYVEVMFSLTVAVIDVLKILVFCGFSAKNGVLVSMISALFGTSRRNVFGLTNMLVLRMLC